MQPTNSKSSNSLMLNGSLIVMWASELQGNQDIVTITSFVIINSSDRKNISRSNQMCGHNGAKVNVLLLGVDMENHIDSIILSPI